MHALAIGTLKKLYFKLCGSRTNTDYHQVQPSYLNDVIMSNWITDLEIVEIVFFIIGTGHSILGQ